MSTLERDVGNQHPERAMSEPSETDKLYAKILEAATLEDGYRVLDGALAAARAEIEDLTTECKVWAATVNNLGGQVVDLRAQVDAARKALESIALDDIFDVTMREIATKALASLPAHPADKEPT